MQQGIKLLLILSVVVQARAAKPKDASEELNQLMKRLKISGVPQSNSQTNLLIELWRMKKQDQTDHFFKRQQNDVTKIAASGNKKD